MPVIGAPACALGGELVAEREYRSASLAMRDAEAFDRLHFDIDISTIAQVTVSDSVRRAYRLRAWRRPDDLLTKSAVKACALAVAS